MSFQACCRLLPSGAKLSLLARYEDELEHTGKTSLSDAELREIFDAKAKALVGLSGPDALRIILSNTAPDDSKWAQLIALASLMD